MDTARYTEYFDADGNYHAVLDGHAVTIPYSAIVCDMDTGMDTDMDADIYDAGDCLTACTWNADRRAWEYRPRDGHGATLPIHATDHGSRYTYRAVIDADADAASRRLHPLRVPRRPVGGGGRAPSG